VNNPVEACANPDGAPMLRVAEMQPELRGVTMSSAVFSIIHAGPQHFHMDVKNKPSSSRRAEGVPLFKTRTVAILHTRGQKSQEPGFVADMLHGLHMSTQTSAPPNAPRDKCSSLTVIGSFPVGKLSTFHL